MLIFLVRKSSGIIDVNTRNPETGETAVSLAEKIGNQEVIDLCVSTAAHTNRP